MSYGYNVRLDVFKIANSDDGDDYVGGAQPTGTYIGTVDARIQEVAPSMFILQQGGNVLKTFRARVGDKNVPIREDDEVEIAYPTDHQYYRQRLVVVAASASSVRKSDSRYFRNLVLQRMERSWRNGV